MKKLLVALVAVCAFSGYLLAQDAGAKKKEPVKGKEAVVKGKEAAAKGKEAAAQKEAETRPVVMCEYVHSMGNSTGNLTTPRTATVGCQSSSSVASANAGKRCKSAARPICPSSRANGAPRQ